jgi:6,7-dimethyl-8-ribityllumazine synthase
VVYAVPGTWEIPVVAAELIRRKEVNALVALGCILQGQTTHAQLLAGDVSHALMDLQVQTGVPIAWGILTPDTADQAIDRAGMKMGNKGREAASAAIEMANVLAVRNN